MSLETELAAAQAEIRRLKTIIDNPDPQNFMTAAVTEAQYQRTLRDDTWKTDADWFWLIGHLAGKAYHRSDVDDRTKLLHRITATAAACANWHAAVTSRPD